MLLNVCVCVPACICEEAEKVCSESVAPYMSSILEALTENISAGIQGMRHTLQTQMDAAFTNGGTGDTKKVKDICVNDQSLQGFLMQISPSFLIIIFGLSMCVWVLCVLFRPCPLCAPPVWISATGRWRT